MFVELTSEFSLLLFFVASFCELQLRQRASMVCTKELIPYSNPILRVQGIYEWFEPRDEGMRFSKRGLALKCCWV